MTIDATGHDVQPDWHDALPGDPHQPQASSPDALAHPELGECLAAYRGDVTRNASWLGSLVMGIVVCCGLLAYMIHHDGLWPGDQGLAIGQLAMAGLAATCAVLLGLAIRNANSRLLLFERGLHLLRGRRLTEIRWDDVAQLYEDISVITYNHGVATQVKHKIRFCLRGQREAQINLSEYPESHEVSGFIAEAVMPRLLAEAQASIAAGSAVDFGFVKVSSAGLERPGTLGGASQLGWRQVAEHQVENGYLTIKSIKGWSKWAGKETESIPNLAVLIALLDRYTKAALLPADQAENSPARMAEC